jgi:hypothetical protein
MSQYRSMPAKWERYVRARNALIPEAASLATRQVGQPSVDEGDAAHGHRWTACFVRELDRLAAPLLRSSNGATPLIEPPAVEAQPVIECWSMRPPEVPCVAAE